MPDSDGYELLDFGGSRKLERFGAICLDRPSPAADRAVVQRPALWETAHARFERERGDQGTWTGCLPPTWSIACGAYQLQLKATPFGHVGMFPEQMANWRWIARQVARRRTVLRVLNLFAYTGGSTLAAAAAGAEVVHVDAARNVVQWARHNAQASGFGDAPIRWITEDAQRFVERERRRQNRYHAIVLDPPSYGHGPKGERWKLTSDLLPLLTECRELLTDDPAFVLLTCHSPGFGPAEAGACVQESLFGHCTSQVVAQSLRLRTADGRRLAAGTVVQWPHA